jgi:Sarcosine oxidase, delta subunit family
MLLIPCPHCGRRPEIEFRCGGEAHIARPARPDEVDDAGWAMGSPRPDLRPDSPPLDGEGLGVG